jgi:hypothetical protein
VIKEVAKDGKCGMRSVKIRDACWILLVAKAWMFGEHFFTTSSSP